MRLDLDKLGIAGLHADGVKDRAHFVIGARPLELIAGQTVEGELGREQYLAGAFLVAIVLGTFEVKKNGFQKEFASQT